MYVDFIETPIGGMPIVHCTRNLPESPHVNDLVPVPMDYSETGGTKTVACRVVAREWKTITAEKPCLICHVIQISTVATGSPDGETPD